MGPLVGPILYNGVIPVSRQPDGKKQKNFSTRQNLFDIT